MMGAFITGLVIGICVSSILTVVVMNGIRQMDAAVNADELLEAWDEIRRLRAQVAGMIGRSS